MEVRDEYVSRKAVICHKITVRKPDEEASQAFCLAKPSIVASATADIRRIRGFLEDEKITGIFMRKKLSEELGPPL
jgi:hypothetical protein